MPGFDTLLPRPVRIEPAPGVCLPPAGTELEVRPAADLPAEGYRLHLTPDGAYAEAADPAGAHYAWQTLRQLRGPHAFRASAIHPGPDRLACGVITDWPRFRWRGCLLDVARHFRTKAEVLRFVDLLGAHKLNVLHLHLTDDQGWRVEIPRYPRLTSVGAWRTGSMVGRHDGPDRDGRPHGGFYTGDDLREIVGYAAERGVTVVPEIDVPGHVRAALAAYPELGVHPDRELDVWTSWGVCHDVLNAEESTVEFFTAVLDTVLEIFPSPVIGIGGDEVPTEQWEHDPRSRRRAAELGLAGPHELHGWFLGRMAAHLRARGRRALGWDEILDAGGRVPADAVVASWRGTGAAVRAATAGHDVVLCPEQDVYLDHRQSDHPDEPIPVGFVRELADVYRYDPLPPELPEGARARVLGAQAQVWSEHLDTARRVDYAVFPRLAAFAEVVWSSGPRDDAEFLPRLRDHHLPRLDALGVEYRPLAGPHPWQTRPGVPGRPRQLTATYRASDLPTCP
ncbi:hexosaminidase [Amycolatopsis arida]|uniref:beta-N-acetylhexosaminidase n=1 Tax=Amycolatopsis arida TaxID=587909 RepID=A0A1I6AGK0_9PSEU|nr:beta-N-acetylhexosaminidase [Amycolatopsis arida]TDX97723.1 hexosaminidase [Amycolatopsis arida]SFQ67790.1 hexosaminidase [Amycolatopsis arida]